MRLHVFVQVTSCFFQIGNDLSSSPAHLLTAMGNRQISKDIKLVTLKLWDQGWDIEDICNILGVSRASLF